MKGSSLDDCSRQSLAVYWYPGLDRSRNSENPEENRYVRKTMPSRIVLQG